LGCTLATACVARVLQQIKHIYYWWISSTCGLQQICHIRGWCFADSFGQRRLQLCCHRQTVLIGHKWCCAEVCCSEVCCATCILCSQALGARFIRSVLLIYVLSVSQEVFRRVQHVSLAPAQSAWSPVRLLQLTVLVVASVMRPRQCITYLIQAMTASWL